MEKDLLGFKRKLVLTFFEVFGVIKGRKRIQKLFYLLKYKFGQPIPFDFVDLYYGPYSQELQEIISDFSDAGLLKESFSSGSGYTYEITGAGKIICQLELQSFPKQLLEIIKLLKEKYKNESTSNIVKEVYKIAYG